MPFIKMSNVTKLYKSEDGVENYALNHVCLSFPDHGLIAVIGKSGSGKSTIINLLALLDKPTSGHVYINNNNVSTWKKKKIEKYHNQEMGIVFQHYHLLENHTVLYNIMLPSLIKGDKEKESKKKAIKLLESISFPKELYEHKCKDLSGGEKERVAVLRAVINEPKIIFCDEPTGALDKNNSIAVMEILKNISRDKLIILVSHDISLTKKYADRLIYIKDGKVEKDEIINELDNKQNKSQNKDVKHHNQWKNKISLSNFKRRFTRNLISIITLSVGLVASLLIVGFANGSTPSIKENSYKQLDYGVLTFSKQKSQSIAGSKISLVQQTRPTYEEISSFSEIIDNYVIENNFSALLSYFPNIKLGEEKLTDFSFRPIYSFASNYIDHSLLIDGYIPPFDNLDEVLINKKGYEYLIKKGIKNPLDISLDISIDKEFHYYTGDDLNPVINDVFSYQKIVHIVGVVDEMDFLSTPKLFYSYSSFTNYLFDYPLINLSSYYERDFSWYERVATANNNDEISSYSFYLFKKDINDIPSIANHIANIEKPYVLESTPQTLSDTLLNLVNAASMGMEIFLFISIIGTALILGIVSFSSYSEDKKMIAILSCLGANRNDVDDIYVLENLFVAIIALIISFILSPLLSLLINFIMNKWLGFSHMIKIPFLSLWGIPFLLVVGLIIITIFIAIISTMLPILLSSKISLKKELADE